jgi:hypothetical protein
MKTEIKEYSEAFEAHVLAQKNVLQAEMEVLRTRHRLNVARQDLFAKEREMMEQVAVDVSKKK